MWMRAQSGTSGRILLFTVVLPYSRHNVIYTHIFVISSHTIVLSVVTLDAISLDCSVSKRNVLHLSKSITFANLCTKSIQVMSSCSRLNKLSLNYDGGAGVLLLPPDMHGAHNSVDVLAFAA